MMTALVLAASLTLAPIAKAPPSWDLYKRTTIDRQVAKARGSQSMARRLTLLPLALQRARQRLRSWEQDWLNHQAWLRARRRPPGPAVASGASTPGSGVYWQLALCESGGNRYAVNPAGPYLSYFQWLLSSWHAYGGTGHPFDASYSEQLAIVRTMSPTHWPVCARRVGLL